MKVEEGWEQSCEQMCLNYMYIPAILLITAAVSSVVSEVNKQCCQGCIGTVSHKSSRTSLRLGYEIDICFSPAASGGRWSITSPHIAWQMQEKYTMAGVRAGSGRRRGGLVARGEVRSVTRLEELESRFQKSLGKSW